MMIVYAILDLRTAATIRLATRSVFVRRGDAERFVEEVRRDDRELASYLRLEELVLEGDGRN